MSALTPEKERLLETGGHILTLGGPGSGKTFIALRKAEREIEKGALKSGQKILFLSFARATVARVSEQAHKLLEAENSGFLEINTYHGFTWKILKSHGYLLSGRKNIRPLAPHEASALGLESEESDDQQLKHHHFEQTGQLHFDLFSIICSQLLSRSQSLLKIICSTYPIIILDEFQDTNKEEWAVIKLLGKASTLIALADAEQRIYEFRGADPMRIGEFIQEYSPNQFDFGTENNRSNGTDIALFGNDLLTGANKEREYKNVAINHYPFRNGIGVHFELKTEILQGYKRLKKIGKAEWSIAVLVPTKRLMLEVSEYLRSNVDRLPAITHEVAIDTAGPMLTAVLIAGLLDSKNRFGTKYKDLVKNLCTHIRGRKGNERPTVADENLAKELEASLMRGTVRGRNRQLIENDGKRITETLRSHVFVGDPVQDWLFLRTLLDDCVSTEFKRVAEDAKHISLLRKGTSLRIRLTDLWKTNGSYSGAYNAVNEAIMQEHFSSSLKEWKGIHVMTIHKSKGKEFDEVFVYEGRHQSRFIRIGATEKDVAQAMLALRVSVTRAKMRVTILTPNNSICPLL